LDHLLFVILAVVDFFKEVTFDVHISEIGDRCGGHWDTWNCAAGRPNRRWLRQLLYMNSSRLALVHLYAQTHYEHDHEENSYSNNHVDPPLNPFTLHLRNITLLVIHHYSLEFFPTHKLILILTTICPLKLLLFCQELQALWRFHRHFNVQHVLVHNQVSVPKSNWRGILSPQILYLLEFLWPSEDQELSIPLFTVFVCTFIIKFLILIPEEIFKIPLYELNRLHGLLIQSFKGHNDFFWKRYWSDCLVFIEQLVDLCFWHLIVFISVKFFVDLFEFF